MITPTIDIDPNRTNCELPGVNEQPRIKYRFSLEFHARVEADLDRLSSLAPNWDSYGAPPIDPQVIEVARGFASKLPGHLIPPPAVVPMAQGNLQFEWHRGPRSLEFEFEFPNTIHYLKWYPEDGVEEEGFFSADNRERAVSLICWFVESVADV